MRQAFGWALPVVRAGIELLMLLVTFALDECTPPLITFIPAGQAWVKLLWLLAVAVWVADLTITTPLSKSALFACPALLMTAEGLSFAVVTAPSAIFLVVTEFFLSCLLPTLFLDTAYPVPPIAITSAMIATTSAGLGRL